MVWTGSIGLAAVVADKARGNAAKSGAATDK